MALPLVVVGLAKLAGLAGVVFGMSSCGGDEGTETAGPTNNTGAANPCEDIKCSEHGSCVPTQDSYVCICDRGYYNEGPFCFRDLPDAPSDGDVGEQADAEAEPDVDSYEEEANNSNQPSDFECECISQLSYRCRTPKESIFIGDCREDERCEDGKCVTNPGIIDPNCGEGMRGSCEVTDIHDIFSTSDDYNDHNVDRNCAQSSASYYLCVANDDNAYQCGEDKAYSLIGNYLEDEDQPKWDTWYAATMHVTPVPDASYYRLDLKKDWFYREPLSSCVADTPDKPSDSCLEMLKPKLDIMFGDEQRTIVPFSDSWERCVYQSMATFTPMGVDGNSVRIQLQNQGRSCDTDPRFGDLCQFYSTLAVAKMRIWSCECVE